MAEENKAAEAKEKDTYLILHAGKNDEGKTREVFLKLRQSEKAGSYFADDKRRVHGYFSMNGEDQMTGAIQLYVNAPTGNKTEDDKDEWALQPMGVIFARDGEYGNYFGGTVAGYDVVKGEKEGVEFVNFKPAPMKEEPGEDGKMYKNPNYEDGVRLSARVAGPSAKNIYDALPIIKDAPAQEEKKSSKPTV